MDRIDYRKVYTGQVPRLLTDKHKNRRSQA